MTLGRSDSKVRTFFEYLLFFHFYNQKKYKEKKISDTELKVKEGFRGG